MNLQDKLENVGLVNVFQTLSIGKMNGSLFIKGEKGGTVMVFKEGMIVRGECNFLEEGLDEQLLSSWLVSADQLKLAHKVHKELPQKSVAEILVDMGGLEQDTLDREVRKRIERIVYHILFWRKGSFRFESDIRNIKNIKEYAEFHDTGYELSRGMSPEYLLLEAARAYDATCSRASFEPLGFCAGPVMASFEKARIQGENKYEKRRDISLLRTLSAELRFPNNSSEIALLALRFASDLFRRGVLFMVETNDVVGLGHFGLESKNTMSTVRDLRINLSSSTFLRGILQKQNHYRGSIARDSGTEKLVREFGGPWPQEAAIFPIIAEGTVVAFLYCDDVSESSLAKGLGKDLGEKSLSQAEGLEIFANQAGLAIEKSLLEQKIQAMSNNSRVSTTKGQKTTVS